MKKLLTAAALLALALPASAAGTAKPATDPAMKEMCDRMVADKADAKAMKDAGCPVAKKAKKMGHDHAKVHKLM